MNHKHAPDPLLPHSGLQALKVILEKNEPADRLPLWFRLIHWRRRRRIIARLKKGVS